ncbi:hypothetical protein [Paraburkholderia sp. J76]|nr:hypothetical protein [Paraburkholderia sp. J76]
MGVSTFTAVVVAFVVGAAAMAYYNDRKEHDRKRREWERGERDDYPGF